MTRLRAYLRTARLRRVEARRYRREWAATRRAVAARRDAEHVAWVRGLKEDA